MNENEWNQWFKDISFKEHVDFFVHAFEGNGTKVYMKEKWQHKNIDICVEKFGDRKILRHFRNILFQTVKNFLERGMSLDKEEIVDMSVAEAMRISPSLSAEEGDIERAIIDCIARRIMYSLPDEPQGEVWIEEYVESAYTTLFDYLYTKAQKKGLLP